ncbi:MAG TPA: iron chelate uptake ABC transporter family permease subunit, partial [Dehalococcoidia bacterium]|nr:iron chelate uptake ABC transporter family permease subunit [Dehalococcoidia bacterium]
MSFNPVANEPIGAYFSGRRTRLFSILGLSVALVAIVLLATSVGSVHIPILTTFSVLVAKLPLVDIAQTWQGTVETIVLEIRLPRVILAGLVGAALATAGATYQGLFRNPLADPYLIGVAQGASLGAVIGFLLPITW